MVDTDRFLGAIEHHGRLMAATVRELPLDADVPTCPGWTVAHLVGHTAAVYEQKTEIVRSGDTTGRIPWNDALASGADPASVLTQFDERLDEMLALFATADLDRPTYTWCGHDHTARWWVRRLAHETLIHSADAVITAGGVPSADTWLATDGIDEILDEMLTGAPSWAEATIDGDRFDLVTHDRRWQLRWGRFTGTSPNSGTEYADEDLLAFDGDDNPETVIAAPAASINYWLWGRGEISDGTISGDEDMVHRIRKYAAGATG